MQKKGFFIGLVFLLLLLPLLACSPGNGRINQEWEIIQAIPERWKKRSKLIVAIAKHETGNFSSNVFLKCNNAFGLKTVTPTKCPAPKNEGVGLFYRDFLNAGESVKAFVSWLEKRGITPEMSEMEILEKMGKVGYYTDKNYIQKVKGLL